MQSSERDRNAKVTHGFVSEIPLCQNTQILNAQTNISFNTNQGLNSTMLLKFNNNGTSETRHSKHNENNNVYENDAFNIHATHYNLCKKTKEA